MNTVPDPEEVGKAQFNLATPTYTAIACTGIRITI